MRAPLHGSSDVRDRIEADQGGGAERALDNASWHYEGTYGYIPQTVALPSRAS